MGFVQTRHIISTALVEVAVRLLLVKEQPVLVLFGGCSHAVEDVKITLSFSLETQTRLLQQIMLDLGATNVELLIKLDLDVLAKTRRVMITDGSGIAHGLQHGYCGKQHLLDLGDSGRGTSSKIAQHVLGTLSFTSTRLTTDKDRDVCQLVFHDREGGLRNGVQVRRLHTNTMTNVFLDHVGFIDLHLLVRIDCTENGRGVGVNDIGMVTIPDVGQKELFRHVVHLCHVIVADIGHQSAKADVCLRSDIFFLLLLGTLGLRILLLGSRG
mmetsp:Transcript_9724/g.24306  ORF Transcript_9724/g.24306 Transcript_9724/m.24306 type:complete len:269 (-) Transcript_9724:94-900(-)